MAPKKIHIEESKVKLNKHVPVNFFENMEKEILHATIEKKKVVFLKWAFSSAAAIVLFLGLYIVFKAPNTPDPSISAISTEVILDNEEIEYTNEEIASLVSMNELNSLENEILNEFKQTDVSDEMEVLDMYDEI